jgi:hypothetical protein
MVPNFIADTTFNMLGYLDQALEKRTGMSRSTMALDPEALQNQTAEAVRAGKDAQYSKVELIARNFAQDLKALFRGILKLLVAHQDRPMMIRLRNQWVEMDPRGWNAEMDVTVNTGLGTGSRERDLAMLMQVYQGQTNLMQMAAQFGGPELAVKVVPPQKLLHTLRKAVNAAGLKDADEFFGEITDQDLAAIQQAKQSQPDPEMQKAQGQLQIAQMKAQADAQLGQQKAQADLALQREKAQVDVQAARERAGLEIQMMRDKAAAELQIRREEAALNADLKREEMRLEAELTRESNMMKASLDADRQQADNNIKGAQ